MKGGPGRRRRSDFFPSRSDDGIRGDFIVKEATRRGAIPSDVNDEDFTPSIAHHQQGIKIVHYL